MADDTNRAGDVFVDDQTGATTRVSVASDGTQGNDHSGGSLISAGGRFIAFNSNASNLVAGDTNGEGDVFIHDRETGATTLVSLSSSGAQASNSVGVCGLSNDARFVAFSSYATDLVAGDTNWTSDVFVRDRQSGTTMRVSVDTAGAQASGDSGSCTLSADGRIVAFHSLASNLVAGDTNNAADVFVHDRQTGSTTRVSVASGGGQANADSAYYGVGLSADGRFVTFDSEASNLVAGDTNNVRDVFVRDRQSGATTRESVGEGGAQSGGGSYAGSISEDGHLVAFLADASNLVAGDTNNETDVFVHDHLRGTTIRASVESARAQANQRSQSPEISAGGRFVAFDSYSSNLIAEDTNRASDVFVHDLQSGATTRVSGGTVVPRCRVPSLVGLRLATARARIAPANCSLGRIRVKRSAQPPRRVLAQVPKPGADLPRGSQVSLVISRSRRPVAGYTFIVFRCGEGYANLCGTVPETGELRQLTSDGDPQRAGSRSFVRFHRGYRGPSLSRDGRQLSFGFDGSAYVAQQNAKARVRVGKLTKVGFTSMRPDGRRLVLINRVWRCIGGRGTGVCRGRGSLVMTTPRGTVLRRISGIWDADWAAGRLVTSGSSESLSLFSGRRLRHERMLVQRNAWSLQDPAVSPDGRRVAVGVVGQRDAFIAVFSMATGKVVRRLTTGPLDVDPEWSPNGKRIVFGRYTRPCEEVDPCMELYTVRSDRRGRPRSLGVQGLESTWGVRRK